MKGCKVEFSKGNIVVTNSFTKAAADLGSQEYAYLQKVCSDFPNMKVVQSRHRSGNTRNRNLTYENMEHFIRCLPNCSELLKEFYFLRDDAKVTKSRYARVRKWFEEQFPEYDKNPLFYVKNTVVPLPATKQNDEAA